MTDAEAETWRKAAIDAIARSGVVSEQAKQERVRIRETLERSDALDRKQERSLLQRVVEDLKPSKT